MLNFVREKEFKNKKICFSDEAKNYFTTTVVK